MRYMIKIMCSVFLAVVMIAAALYSLPGEAAVNSDKILEEIAEQTQNDNNYAFDYREKEGDGFEADGSNDYPESFDLRNVDTDGDGQGDTSYVTPVKFQNPFGSCWAFAAVAAAETSILGTPNLQSKNLNAETMNLSEKHLAWFLMQPIDDKDNPQYGEGGVFGDGEKDKDATRYDAGGIPIYATSMFSSGIGPVFEHSDNPASEALFGDCLEYHGKNKKIETSEDGTPYCYSADDDWSIDSSLRFYQSFRLKETYQLPSPAMVSDHFKASAIAAMKEQLMNKRALEIGYCADSSMPVDADNKEKATRYISDKWAHYTFDDGTASHAVTVVGWDDNYPKENFTHKIAPYKDENGDDVIIDDEEAARLTTPKHNGAWLVKNSWGSGTEEFPNNGGGDWGIPVEKRDKDGNVVIGEDGNPVMVGSGYFWLSYEDKSLFDPEALAFDKKNDKEYNVFQHDYMPVSYIRSAAIEEKLSTSNVFVADVSIKINEITCQTTTPNTKVHYELYALNDNFANPLDGEKLYETDAVYSYGGFHRQDIDKDCVIAKGKKFSVVVTQQAPNDMYMLNVHFSTNKNVAVEQASLDYYKGVVNKGESFFNAGNHWIDMSEPWVKNLILDQDSFYYDMDNFPIKAYGEEVNIPEPKHVPEPVNPSVEQKKANPLKVTTKAKTVKAKKLKNKKQTVKAVTVKNAKGKVTFAKVKKGSSSAIYKKVSVNKKTGKITIKKGKYQKKTYKIAVKVKAAGDADYKSGSKTVKVKITVE